MKPLGWLILAAIILVGIIWFSYNAGYTVGADMAERENRADSQSE